MPPQPRSLELRGYAESHQCLERKQHRNRDRFSVQGVA